MISQSQNDTICAIATPAGAGGIGIVRISGPKAVTILEKLWRGKTRVESFETRRLYLGVVSGARGETIDRVMAVLMKAPQTYTGEDTVELSCHGSPVVLKRLLASCIAGGARLAQPGEFTRRAFMAGKIDLAQAEAVGDLISSTSERAARIASLQLEGRLSNEIKNFGEEIASIRAEIETSIDFPEEDLDASSKKKLAEKISTILKDVTKLSSTFGEGRLIRDGVRVAIVGRPNVGKSSIFNRLVGMERAIVHHVPGTTRDVVEEVVQLGGVTFRLCDTAGLRDTDCEVETLGIDKTHKEIGAADLVLAVFDSTQPLNIEDEKFLKNFDHAKTIFVVNKIDLKPSLPLETVSQFPLPSWERVRVRGKSKLIPLSAKTGEGFDKLVKALESFVSSKLIAHDGVIVTNTRHAAHLKDTISTMQGALASFNNNEPPECVASHLALAQNALGQITGAITSDDILDKIFSKFCIGK